MATPTPTAAALASHIDSQVTMYGTEPFHTSMFDGAGVVRRVRSGGQVWGIGTRAKTGELIAVSGNRWVSAA